MSVGKIQCTISSEFTIKEDETMLFGEKILENCPIDKGLLSTYYKKVICNFDEMILEYSIEELSNLTDIFRYKISEFLPPDAEVKVEYKERNIFVNCL